MSAASYDEVMSFIELLMLAIVLALSRAASVPSSRTIVASAVISGAIS